MALYPVFLDLAGEPVLVVGGGAVALRKTRGLTQTGARVTVVAPSLHPEFETMTVTVRARPFQPSDLEGVRLVFACTNDGTVNDDIAAEARARGLWCNHASTPAHGDLRLGAVVRRGPVQVSVSTGAELPVLSQALRDRVAAALPDALPVDAWAERRAAALALPEPQRELVLETLNAEIRRAVSA